MQHCCVSPWGRIYTISDDVCDHIQVLMFLMPHGPRHYTRRHSLDLRVGHELVRCLILRHDVVDRLQCEPSGVHLGDEGVTLDVLRGG
jgi:hypothetical protein